MKTRLMLSTPIYRLKYPLTACLWVLLSFGACADDNLGINQSEMFGVTIREAELDIANLRSVVVVNDKIVAQTGQGSNSGFAVFDVHTLEKLWSAEDPYAFFSMSYGSDPAIVSVVVDKEFYESIDHQTVYSVAEGKLFETSKPLGGALESSPNGRYFFTQRSPHSSSFLTVLDRDGKKLFSHPEEQGSWYAKSFSDEVLVIFLGKEIRFLDATTGATLSTMTLSVGLERRDRFPTQPICRFPADGGQMFLAWRGKRMLIDSNFNVTWERKHESGLYNASFSDDAKLLALFEQIQYGVSGHQLTLLDTKSGDAYWSTPVPFAGVAGTSDHRDVEFIGNYVRILSPQTRYICEGTLDEDAESHLFKLDPKDNRLIATEILPGALFISNSRKSLMTLQVSPGRTHFVEVKERSHEIKR